MKARHRFKSAPMRNLEAAVFQSLAVVSSCNRSKLAASNKSIGPPAYSFSKKRSRACTTRTSDPSTSKVRALRTACDCHRLAGRRRSQGTKLSPIGRSTTTTPTTGSSGAPRRTSTRSPLALSCPASLSISTGLSRISRSRSFVARTTLWNASASPPIRAQGTFRFSRTLKILRRA